MSNIGDGVKTIAAIAGLIAMVYTAGGAFAGKAEATDVAETKERLSVVESRLDSIEKKIDRLLERRAL